MDGVRSTVFLLSFLSILFGHPNYIFEGRGCVTLFLALTGASRLALRGMFRQL